MRERYQNKNCGIYELNKCTHTFFCVHVCVSKMHLTQKPMHVTVAGREDESLLQKHLNNSENHCKARMVLKGDLCFLFSLISFCNTKIPHLLLCVFPYSSL